MRSLGPVCADTRAAAAQPVARGPRRSFRTNPRLLLISAMFGCLNHSIAQICNEYRTVRLMLLRTGEPSAAGCCV